MARNAGTEPIPFVETIPHFDWREWLAFAGCVLGTALFVSVVLGALVLVVSTQVAAVPAHDEVPSATLPQGPTS